MELVKCNTCGANQEISKDVNCSYCGILLKFNEAKQKYSDSIKGEFGNFLILAETALEGGDYSEAINYYNKILEKKINYSDAWLGKANAMIYTSKIGDIKMKEALTCWKNSVKFSENKNHMKLRVGKEINQVIKSFFPNILNHYAEFSNLEDSYAELASRFITLESGISYACDICPEEAGFFKTGYDLCDQIIKAPQSYAAEEQSAAISGAILGALSGNKHDQRKANDSWNSASARKEQIKNFSSQITSLKSKYIDGLIRLGVMTEEEKEEKEETNKLISKGGSWYNTGWVWVVLILFWPIGLYGLIMRYKK